jgi:hypothetical protein
VPAGIRAAAGAAATAAMPIASAAGIIDDRMTISFVFVSQTTSAGGACSLRPRLAGAAPARPRCRINRAGKNLPAARRRTLMRAKDELRRQFGRNRPGKQTRSHGRTLP